MADETVWIAGGGIAGLAAALFLLRDGCNVRLWEAQRGPLDRVCGEGLLPFGVAVLQELGLREQAEAAGHPIEGLRFLCGKKEAVASFPSGITGIGIHRFELDQILRDACARYTCRTSPRFERVEGQKLLPDRPHQALLFAADGIHSRFAAHSSKPTSKRIGMRFRIQTQPDAKVTVHFLRGCEIYLTPTGLDSLSVAILIDPQKAGLPGAQLRDWALTHFRKACPEYAHLPLEAFATRAPLASRAQGKQSQFLLGDALQAFDPISGAGMSFALSCAQAASRNKRQIYSYYHDIEKLRKNLQRITDLLLWIRGGGLKSQVALSILQGLPRLFQRLAHQHAIGTVGMPGKDE